MCCSPDHLGAPPEWRRELAAEGLAAELPEPAVTAATLAAWAWYLGNRPPGPVAASTEGGHGRALPTAVFVGSRFIGRGVPRDRDDAHLAEGEL